MRGYLAGRKELLANQYRDHRNVQAVSRQDRTSKDRLVCPRCSQDTGVKYNQQPEALSRPLAQSYPFLLPSDSIVAGLERKPRG